MSEQTGSWQPDPFGRHQYRYWDGTQWTDQVADDGVTSVDPPVPVAGGEAAAAPEAPGEPTPAAAPAPTEPVAEVPSSTPPQGWSAPDQTAAFAATPAPGAGAPGGPAGPTGGSTATGGSGGGSNTPGIIVGVVLLLAVIGGAVWFFFLRSDDSDGRATVVAKIRDEFGASDSQANCVADELDDRLDLGDLAEDIEADRDPTGAQVIAILEALDECGLGFDTDLDDGDDGDETTTTTEDDTDEGSSGGGGSGMSPELLDAIAAGMMESSDLTQSQARCFAETLFSMDGFDIDEAMSDPAGFAAMMAAPDADMIAAFFAAFDECDIDPSAFGGGSTGGGGASGGFQPGQSYGDNPVLDALWDRCEDGDGAACDELYFTSEIGSDYEEFGDTCGGRVEAGTVYCTDELG